MADPSVADLKRSFELHLRAENKAVRTIETYLDALQLAARFLEARGVELEQARREDMEAFIADQLAHWKPATAANRYRSLHVFYGWLEVRRDTALICSWSPAFPNADATTTSSRREGRTTSAVLGVLA
jgi:site-specific recombinase XerD